MTSFSVFTLIPSAKTLIPKESHSEWTRNFWGGILFYPLHLPPLVVIFAFSSAPHLFFSLPTLLRSKRRLPPRHCTYHFSLICSADSPGVVLETLRCLFPSGMENCSPRPHQSARHSRPVFPFGLSHLSVSYLYRPQTTERCGANTHSFTLQMLGSEFQALPPPEKPQQSTGTLVDFLHIL